MSVTSVVNPNSPRRSAPYITPDMFRTHARAGVQTQALAPGGKPGDNEAALWDFIEQGSSWMDEMAERIFASTVDTWVTQVDVGTDGSIEIFPRYKPVVGLMGLSVGWDPNPSNLVALPSLGNIGFGENSFTVSAYPGPGRWTSEGLLQFGGFPMANCQAWVQMEYVHSYPVTYLTDDVMAGASTIQVADTVGIVGGKSRLIVRSGQTRQRVLVTDVSTADAGGLGSGPGVLTLASPIPTAIVNPDIPIQVDGLLPDLVTCCVLATRSLIRGKTPSTSERGKGRKVTAGDDLAEAWTILQRAMQVVHQ